MAMAYLKNQIILIQGVILAPCISHCYRRGENSNDHDAAPKRAASVVLSTNKLVLPRRPPD